MDITEPVVVTVSPPNGGIAMGAVPSVTIFVTDPGNPPSGIDAASLNVRIREKSPAGELSAPVLVVDSGVISSGTSWSESYIYSGAVAGEVINSAGDTYDSETTITLRLLRNSPVPHMTGVEVSVVVADKDGNSSGSADAYQFAYRVKPSPIWGESGDLEEVIPELYAAVTNPFPGPKYQSVETLRKAMLVTPLNYEEVALANSPQRALRRLLQMAKATGRHHHINHYWDLREEHYISGPILGARQMWKIREGEGYKLIGAVKAAKATVRSIIGASSIVERNIIDDIERDCATATHLNKTVIEAVLILLYTCRLRLEKPELFVG